MLTDVLPTLMHAGVSRRWCVQQAGVEGTVVPRTFDTAAAAFKTLSADPSASKVVFVKDVNGAGGLDIVCKQVSSLERYKLSPDAIIQEGATDFALVDGRKWTIRAYVVVHGGRLYVSRHFNGFKHPSRYNPDADAADLEQQHISNGNTNAHVKAKSFADVGGRLMGPSDLEDADVWTEALIDATRQMAQMYEAMVAATADDPYRYHIFGVDAIPRTSGTVQIIEVNPFPNLVAFEAQPGKGNPDLASCIKYSTEKVKMVASVLRLLFGMETAASSKELASVYTYESNGKELANVHTC